MTNIITIVYKHGQSNYCTQLIIIIMVRDESIIDFTLFKLTATIQIKINVTSQFLLDDQHGYKTNKDCRL